MACTSVLDWAPEAPCSGRSLTTLKLPPVGAAADDRPPVASDAALSASDATSHRRSASEPRSRPPRDVGCCRLAWTSLALVVVTAGRDQRDDGDQHERQEPLPPDFHAPPFVVHAPPSQGAPRHPRPNLRAALRDDDRGSILPMQACARGTRRAPLQPCISAMLSAPSRAWRNGRRGGLKNRWATARVGSIPTARIAAARDAAGYAGSGAQRGHEAVDEAAQLPPSSSAVHG